MKDTQQSFIPKTKESHCFKKEHSPYKQATHQYSKGAKKRDRNCGQHQQKKTKKKATMPTTYHQLNKDMLPKPSKQKTMSPGQDSQQSQYKNASQNLIKHKRDK